MPGVLKVWDDWTDPQNPYWKRITGGGGLGPIGPAGPTGPTGPTGPISDSLEEVYYGTTPPDLVAQPNIELWYDPDETAPLGAVSLPLGGVTDQALTKISNTDGDVGWRGPYLTFAGGTVDALTVLNDVTVGSDLTAPNVLGDVYIEGGLSALTVTERTNPYTWEVYDLAPSYAPNWGHGDFQNGMFPGPHHVYRNRYSVVLALSAHIAPGNWQENVWMDVLNPGSLPVGYRPGFDLWDTRMSVETDESGSLFEIRVTNTGSVQVNMKGWTLDWQDDTRIPINFGYPRSA